MNSPDMDTRHALIAPHALLSSGWARDVLLRWDTAGTLIDVTPDAGHVESVQHAPGAVIPGMPNLHSHAFQRALAGLTEYRAASDDSFWSWRELMYRFAGALTPQTLEDIAIHLYIEMLQAGYTSVCEFHYVHHQADGQAHAEPAEMALRIVSAARRAGIGLTLLPVLYQTSGFGALPPRAEQRRFIHRLDRFIQLIERLQAADARIGIAPHSLRAVPPEALRDAVDAMTRIDAHAPVHIHIAEQQREVDDCIAWSGQRPLQWLLGHLPVDARWCLVHATHVDDAELRAIVASGATVGLCPSTEANLGDGVFPAERFVELGGTWGIGSDSQVSVDAADELRWLEYGQRLVLGRRNVLASSATPHLAQRLWRDAVAGGARASGRAIAGLAAGQRADFVVLDDAAMLHGLSPDQALATHLFARAGHSALRETWVGGHRCVADGEHPLAREARRRFVAARTELLQASR